MKILHNLLHILHCYLQTGVRHGAGWGAEPDVCPGSGSPGAQPPQAQPVHRRQPLQAGTGHRAAQ